MGRNVTARQRGDDYQAKIFWLKASESFIPSSNIENVAWEVDTAIGFDDVVVFYQPAKLESGSEVKEEYYQVKFHVDYSKGFSCEALIDPDFIGTKKESLLQRLYSIYKTKAENYSEARYIIINTWGITSSDVLGELLSNNGAIRLERLSQGGEGSKFGKIRRLWKSHLQITSDSELNEVLAPLRIKHSFDDEERLKENLNVRLALAGLKQLPADQISCQYTDLIQKLHTNGKNTFTKEELFQICKREGLVEEKQIISKDAYIIGIRSFQKGAESLELEVHSILCLLHCFAGRFLLEAESWSDISQQIKAFAESAISLGKPLVIHLDTHLSMALLLGYCMNVKYGGIDVTIVQKTFSGKISWKPISEKVNEYKESLWNFEEKDCDSEGSEMSLALSVTHNINLYVEEYLNLQLPQVSKSLYATIKPKAGFTSIQDASHIVAAVQEIIAKAREIKRGNLRVGKLHLFLAAPNAFAFFLGQQLNPLGNVILYEFDFENSKNGTYNPAISLPA